MGLPKQTLAAVNDEARWNASEALAGVGTFGLDITGAPTVVFEARVRGSTTWVSVQAVNLTTGALAVNATAAGLFRIDLSGQLEFRVRMTVVGGGTVDVWPGVSLG